MTKEVKANSAGFAKYDSHLLLASLAPFYLGAQTLAFALLRVAFGLTIVTHGIPKLLGMPHGSMANPMHGSINLITNALNLPFAPQLALLVAVLETFGGLAVALGFATRLIALMLAVEMVFVSVALGPTFPWIDRGIEYPMMLCFVALLICAYGGGIYSIDRYIGREL